jgi:hypothetical protein
MTKQKDTANSLTGKPLMKCAHDPKQYAGMPIGMYRCPECGEMVIAGCDHTDYDGVFKELSKNQQAGEP